MAEIKAFKGLRYNTEIAGEIAELCCPPYDIISEEQRLGYIGANENNIIRLELPKGEDAYKNACEILKMWEEKGVLVKEDKPAIYIYEEEFTVYGHRKCIKGIIARVKLEEFEKGIILPHEHTLSKAKEDRLNLMKATNSNFSPIYALYMDDDHTTMKTVDKQCTEDAVLEFTDCEEVTHRLWVITDEAVIEKLCNDFADRKLYIADGHHRYETALNYRNYCRENGISKEGDAQDYQMIFMCDMEHPGLVVLPTHRLVRDLQSFSKDEVLSKCKKLFSITEYEGVEDMGTILYQQYKKDKNAFGFYCGGNKWNMLVLKNSDTVKKHCPKLSKALRSLDVTVLHSLVLEEIFGIDKENMAQQINLTYSKYFEEAISSVDSGKAQCSFIMNPTRVEQIKDVASNGEKMPQKSTYFYPKMITGMVMNKLD